MLELEVISRIGSKQSLWFPCQETLGTGALRYYRQQIHRPIYGAWSIFKIGI